MHNDVTGCVILISNKTEYLEKYQRSYIMILTDLSNAINNLWEKISFHKQFKLVRAQLKILQGREAPEVKSKLYENTEVRYNNALFLINSQIQLIYSNITI